MGNDLCVAWPRAEIAVMGAAGAVQILHARALAGLPVDEHGEERARLEADYERIHLNPDEATRRGFVDAVIEPAQHARGAVPRPAVTARQALRARSRASTTTAPADARLRVVLLWGVLRAAGILARWLPTTSTWSDERVVVFDGATGTYLQALELTADDYGGPDARGLHRHPLPDPARDHRPDAPRLLQAGADVVETNSFGAFGPPLAEYGLVEKAHEMNVAAASIARGVADELSTPDRPRFVAGSMGPGTKSPTLAQIPYATLRDDYEVMARGLLEGGVDLFIIETQFDLLGGEGRHQRDPAGDGRRRTRGARPGAGHHRAHRAHAARHRDRRRARRARPDEARHHRAQLRHRPDRDGRAPPLPVPARPHAGVGAPERRAALGGRRQDALRPRTRGVRRPRPSLHRGLRRPASSVAAAAPRPSTSASSPRPPRQRRRRSATPTTRTASPRSTRSRPSTRRAPAPRRRS